MINFVEYVKQLWDTTVKFGPTRMNHMEDGIKGNSDAVVGLNEALDDVDTLIGDTSISGIGDGTVTGAISAVNVNLTNIQTVVLSKSYCVIKSTNADTTITISAENRDQVIPFCGRDGSNRLYNGCFIRANNTWFVAQNGSASLSIVSSTATSITISCTQWTILQLTSFYRVS